METNTSWKRLMIVVSLGVALSGVSAYPTDSTDSTAIAYSELTSASPMVASPSQSIDPVTEWNQHAVSFTLSASPALAPVQQTRVMAIVQVAVHDAVNGITSEYATYLSPGSSPANATPEAAAIAAAHHALKGIFTSMTQTQQLDSLYLASLAAHALSADDPGIAYGRSASAQILAARSNDNSAQAQFSYTAPGAGSPGVWVHTTSAPALLPGWGNVTPFVLKSGSQFRPDPPPALDSEQYANDYNEVKQIGVSIGSTRTPEQSLIATFWRASPTAIWNDVLRQVLATRELDLSATARAFALFYLSAADASIACWEAKYTYNFWRPEPAIRSGHLDGNDFTIADSTWTPFIATPAHPEYPSGHTSNSGAMAAILAQLFGDDPGVSIAVTITGITRQWDTFSEAVEEVIDARVYSGFHFRTADRVGARLGRQVARFISTHALKPCPNGGSRSSCSNSQSLL
ncbi:MAG TPA: vanadium-dependent haloperoxidase [Blastocatellia bacterium]|nr:vanadium-dependent haloperoxidase [Blastocatellia bacterium]